MIALSMYVPFIALTSDFNIAMSVSILKNVLEETVSGISSPILWAPFELHIFFCIGLTFMT